uniref:protein-tyrosine-phosphatase n=3 Tax=Parascaris TaxID=6254 RepID=A0A915BHG0_PARUN
MFALERCQRCWRRWDAQRCGKIPPSDGLLFLTITNRGEWHFSINNGVWRIMFTVNGRICGRLAEIIPEQLYFCSFYDRPKSDASTSYYYVDDDVHYDSFYSDFGPLNLSVLYRFCVKLDEKLKALSGKKRIVVCSGSSDEARVNAAYLVGSFCVIYLGVTAEIAYLRLHKAEPNGFVGFRDAAMGAPTYRLHLHNVLRGVEKAFKLKWVSFESFDPDEYEFYERVENGDFNWIIPGKVLSFCGPHNKSIVENGYPYHAPEVYFDYFRRHNVSTIIRLNKRMYDAKRFVDAGFDHVDLFFVDGSTPSDDIVQRFINVIDSAKGAVAVHCKAGLGRTGTLIACWMMKEYGVTAAESMAWLRICRPGSVIGPQQQFLIEKQPWCWALATARTSSTSHLSQLASKVDEIRICDVKKSGTLIRPIALSKKVQRSSEATDETSVDAMGRTQGDRLLAMKVKAQHHQGTAKFTSPTTPVKPVVISQSRPAGNHARRLLHCTVEHIPQPAPISRVTVSSTCGRPAVVKSKSSKRLVGIRSKPYPPAGVKIQMPPSSYELRPRHSFNASQLRDLAKTLPPNSDALIGKRRSANTRSS